MTVEIGRTPQGCNVVIRTRGMRMDILLWVNGPQLEDHIRGRETFYPGLDR
jgi:hypothetical protein